MTWVRYASYLGPWVPDEELLWQDPVPAVDHELIDDGDVASLKARSSTPVCRSLSSCRPHGPRRRRIGTPTSAVVRTGGNRLAPQAGWDINVTSGVSQVLGALEGIQQEFNASQTGGKKVSMADLILLGGCAGVEAAAKAAGYHVQVPLRAGTYRRDSRADRRRGLCGARAGRRRIRNYFQKGAPLAAEHMLVDKAFMLNLSAPEMTVLLGGMRALNANVGQSKEGVFTNRPETLTNDFFVNLLDMATEWKPVAEGGRGVRGPQPHDGRGEVTGTRVDLVFGSNSELRALAEVYASSDAGEKFVEDFVAAWDKVMTNDRFDLK